jgi:hypothetical protein
VENTRPGDGYLCLAIANHGGGDVGYMPTSGENISSALLLN